MYQKENEKRTKEEQVKKAAKGYIQKQNHNKTINSLHFIFEY